MKNKSTLLIALAVMTISIIGISSNDAAAKHADSLRVGMVMKGIKALPAMIQDSIVPGLEGDEKKKMKEMVSQLKAMLKKSEQMFLDTMQTDFKKLSPEEKANLTEMEKQISTIKTALPEKSKDYHLVTIAHLPVYRAIQEMRTDGRTPLLGTYKEPYDPNTTTNQQVTLIGAYLNFYLEYRINVGGIEMGPDIVDPERVVFTFPSKLLEGLATPTYIEVKAAPKKQTGSGSSARFEDSPEQHVWVLVYPKK